MSERPAEKDADDLGLRFDCPRCGTRHRIACCHASRHNLCDRCVAEQHAERASRLAEAEHVAIHANSDSLFRHSGSLIDCPECRAFPPADGGTHE